jgi:hypothetical protein
MCFDDRWMRRWRRRHVAEPVAGAGPCADTSTGTRSNSDASAHAGTDPRTDANASSGARWRRDDHDYVERRVTEDGDDFAGDARDVHQQ